MWLTVEWLGQTVEPLTVRPGFIPVCSGVLELIISKGYLAQSRYCGNVLGPASKQSARLFALLMGSLTLSEDRWGMG